MTATEPTVYRLDHPGAWGWIGLGSLIALVPLTIIVGCSIPGVFAAWCPNAPKHGPDPLGTGLLAAVAVGLIGAGVWRVASAVRTLRDRGPKLEFNEHGVIDYRGQAVVAWGQLAGIGYSMYADGYSYRAALTLTVMDDAGCRAVEVDLRGLSAQPKAIYDHLGKVRGLA